MERSGPIDPASRRRVLVARLDNDGDVLLAGPAVRAVAASGAEVTLLSGPRGAAAARLLPGVARHATYRAPWIDPEPPPVDLAAIHDVVEVAAGHEEAMILTSFHQDPLPLALLLRIAGVPRIGAICEDYPGSLLDVRHHVEGDVHEVARGLSLARAMGHELPLGDDGRLRVRRAFRGPRVPPSPYVVVHPGASVPARAWAPARCAVLVRLLTAAGLPVVVTGGPSERELTRAVAGTSALDLGGLTTFPGLAEVLAGAAVVVVGNTGPAHLAAAVGTPVVSLFAPTVSPEGWAPFGVETRVLFSPVPCAGCRARECPVPGHPCVDDLAPEAVAEAVTDLIAETAGPAGGSGRHLDTTVPDTTQEYMP